MTAQNSRIVQRQRTETGAGARVQSDAKEVSALCFCFQHSQDEEEEYPFSYLYVLAGVHALIDWRLLVLSSATRECEREYEWLSRWQNSSRENGAIYYPQLRLRTRCLLTSAITSNR